MAPSFTSVSDCGLLVGFGTEINDAANAAVTALDGAVAEAGITGVQETVPAFVNLMVVFDPLVTDHAELETTLRSLIKGMRDVTRKATHRQVDVCYDDDFSPDLASVAQATGMSPDAVISAHLSSTYHVVMYGFAPGYAYLGGVPEEIQVPRKPAAVRDIPAGSVLVAGGQCLVSTLLMPTGWSIIGRSPTQILRDDPQQPFLFDVGDTVTFNRITRDQFDQCRSGDPRG